MDLGIAGKLALVVGGSRGLGYACAKALGDEGATVLILARSAGGIEDAVGKLRAAGVEAHGVVADISDRQSAKSAIEAVKNQYGTPDIFVYNNGGAGDMYFEESSDEDYYNAFNVYIMGFVWCMNELLADMKAKGWSRVVSLGSLCAKEPHKQYPMIMHNMGRAAQLGMNKTLANSVGNTGLTINIIATGMIDHDGGSIKRAYEAHSSAQNMSKEDINYFRTKDIPVGHMGKPEDIASMCAFLCSDKAGFVNGQTILVDGGRVGSLL